MKPKLKRIRDQVVVLVGATSGIGLETALHMVDRGAKVVIVGRSQEGLNDAVLRVRAAAEVARVTPGNGNGGYPHLDYGETIDTGEMDMASAQAARAPFMTSEETVLGLEGDITNFEQMRSVADQVMQRMGRIDTWVNIAAVSEWALFEDTSPDEFRRIIDVNLVGQAYGAMAALPYLKQQHGGALIFVSSIAGKIPIPYQSAYNASKHGLIGLAETLRLELEHTGIPVSVTTLLPASINTPMFDKGRTKLGVEPDPLRPVYDTRLVAKAIIHAATHPVRELIVGDAGHIMTFMRRLSPALSNKYMGTTGFRQQRSNEPKSAQAPDNLYEHISGYDTIEGEYSPQTMRFSPLTWLSIHPRARMALYGSVIAGLGLLVGMRVIKTRAEHRSWRYRLPRQAKKTVTQFSKSAGKTLQSAVRGAGEGLSNVPVINRTPMFRRRQSFIERFGDMIGGALAAVVSILPFISGRSRKSLGQRMLERVSDGVSKVDSLSMADRRRSAAKRIAKGSGKVIEKVNDSRKDAMHEVAKRVPSRRDLKEMAEKARRPVMFRKQSLVERLPFGERRETLIEKLPLKK